MKIILTIYLFRSTKRIGRRIYLTTKNKKLGSFLLILLLVTGCSTSNATILSEISAPEQRHVSTEANQMSESDLNSSHPDSVYEVNPSNPIFEILEALTKEYSYKEMDYVIGKEPIPYPQFDLISDIEVTNKINTDIWGFIHSIAENDSEISIFNYQYQTTFQNEEILSLVFNYYYYHSKGAYPVHFFITRTYNVKDGDYYQLPEDVYKESGFLDALLQKENLVSFDNETKESGLEYIKERQENLENNLDRINNPESQDIQFYFDKDRGICFVFETIHATGDYVILRLT